MKNCTCKDCAQQNPQPLSNFYKNASRSDGYSIWCKKCSKKDRRDRFRNGEMSKSAADILSIKDPLEMLTEITIYYLLGHSVKDCSTFFCIDESKLEKLLIKEDVLELKICKHCCKLKNRNDFNKHIRLSDGLNNYCKSCVKDISNKYYLENREVLLKKNSDFVSKHNKQFAKYDKYCEELKIIEQIRRCPDDSDLLEVQCKFCHKWFNPTIISVKNRIHSISGKTTSSNNLYCSDDCKEACPIFGRIYYRKNQSPPKLYNTTEYDIWRDEVKNRNIVEYGELQCEYCNCKEDLECHHIIPQKVNDNFALDPDNGVVCCKKCHGKKAHKDECSMVNLAKIICMKRK